MGSPRSARQLPDLGLGEPHLRQRRQHALLSRGAGAGPIVAQVVGIRSVDDARQSTIPGKRHEPRPELGLAEVAAIRRVCRVAWIRELVCADLQHGHGEPARHVAGRGPLRFWIGRTFADHGEHVRAAERVYRNAREVRRIDTAAEADEGRAALAKPPDESALLLAQPFLDMLVRLVVHAET